MIASFHQSCHPRNSRMSTPAVSSSSPITPTTLAGRRRCGRRPPRTRRSGRSADMEAILIRAETARLCAERSVRCATSAARVLGCEYSAHSDRIARMARTKSSKPARAEQASGEDAPNPVWFKPVMFGFMLLGLAWIIVFYVSQGRLPDRRPRLVEHPHRLRHRLRRLPHDDSLALSRHHFDQGGRMLRHPPVRHVLHRL